MEQLPLPDNMESIWTDIQTQLDAENIPGSNKPRPGRGKTGLNWRLLIVAGVIIGAIFLFRHPNKNNTKGTTIPDSSQKQRAIPDSTEKTEPVQEHKNQKSKKSSTLLLRHDSLLVPNQDSLFHLPIPVVQPPPGIKMNPPVISVPHLKDSTNTIKKGRGVNLDDSDYKIISHKKPGKD
jgi:hypothetical protein